MKTDADEVLLMLSSRGWGVVKGKLDAKILDLQNINNIDVASVENMVADIKARKMAADLLFEFLKQDVYGFVEQQTTSVQRITDSREAEYVERT